MNNLTKITFTAKDHRDGDKEKKFDVVRPGVDTQRRAQVHYNKAFADALGAGGLLRARVDTYMRNQGLWDETKEQQQKDFVKQLSDLEIKIKKGGIKLSEARSHALKMREIRGKFRELVATRNSLDASTVEGQAENARFNALVSLCLVYNDTGKPYYNNVDEYLEDATNELAYQAASNLGQLLFRLDESYEQNLPENQFLKRFHFVDEKLRLVNKAGQLTDEDGRLINEEGRYIDADNNYVDKQGRRVDEDGGYIVDKQPFFEDDGETPIVEAETETPVESSGETAE